MTASLGVSESDLTPLLVESPSLGCCTIVVMSSPLDVNPFNSSSFVLTAPTNNPFSLANDTPNPFAAATSPTTPPSSPPPSFQDFANRIQKQQSTNDDIVTPLSVLRLPKGRNLSPNTSPPLAPRVKTPPPTRLTALFDNEEMIRPPTQDITSILAQADTLDAATLSVARLYSHLTTSSSACEVTNINIEQMLSDVKQVSSERNDTAIVLLCACGVIAHLGSNNAATSLNEQDLMAVVAQAITEHMETPSVMIQAVGAAACIRPSFVRDHILNLISVVELHEGDEYIQAAGLFAAARLLPLCHDKALFRLVIQRQKKFPKNKAIAQSMCAIIHQTDDVKLEEKALVVDELDGPIGKTQTVTPTLPVAADGDNDSNVTVSTSTEAPQNTSWKCRAKCGLEFELTTTKRAVLNHLQQCVGKAHLSPLDYAIVLTHDHPLFYETAPYPNSSQYYCNACGERQTAPVYQCYPCSYDLCLTCIAYHRAGHDRFVWEMQSPLGDWQVLDELSCRQIYAAHIVERKTQLTLKSSRRRLYTHIDLNKSVASDMQSGRTVMLRQRESDDTTRQRQLKFVHVWSKRYQRTTDETHSRTLTLDDLMQMSIALTDFAAESAVVRRGLQLILMNLSYKRTDVPLITSADTVKAVVRSMEIDDISDTATSDAVLFLHNMCFSVNNITLALSPTATPSVSSVLRASRAFFMAAAMRKYYRPDGSLIHNAALQSEYESAKCDVQLVVDWLNSHIDSAVVSTYCCKIIPRLFSTAEYNNDVIVSAGCADAVLMAMKRHSASDDLQYAASLVLLRLAAVTTSHRLIAAGGLQTLARCCHNEHISKETQAILERLLASAVSHPLKGVAATTNDDGAVTAAALTSSMSTERRLWDLFGDVHFVVRCVFPLLSDRSFIRANQVNRATYHFWYHWYSMKTPLQLSQLTRSSGLVRAFECHLSGSRLQCCVDAKAIAQERQVGVLPSPRVERLKITDILDPEWWTQCLPHVRSVDWVTKEFIPALIPPSVTHLRIDGCRSVMSLPVSLHALEFAETTEVPIDVDQLPPSLTSFRGQLCSDDTEPTMLPATLTSLQLVVDHNALAITLPPSLRRIHLTFTSNANKLDALQSLPPTLTQLTIRSTCDVLSNCRTLPTALTAIDVDYIDYATIKLITQLETLSSLSIRHLVTKDQSNDQQTALTLPQSLSVFDCGDDVSKFRLLLPEQKLQRLQMRGPYQPFHNALPSHLTEIIFPDSFNSPLQAYMLPQTLLIITFGAQFNTEIHCGVLPNKLSNLQFGSSITTNDQFAYEHGFCSGVLPSSLQTLTFNVSYNAAVTVLPRGLKRLTFVRGFNQRLGAGVGVVLPDSLRALSLGATYTQQIDAAALPPRLEYFDAGLGNWMFPLPPLPPTLIQLVAPALREQEIVAPIATFEPHSPLADLTTETGIFTLGNKSRTSDHANNNAYAHGHGHSISATRKKTFRSPKR